MNEPPLTESVINIAVAYQYDSVLYFFEDDATFFSYGNTELMHKEHNLKYPNNFLTYRQLNFNSIDLPGKYDCKFGQSDLGEKTLITVYSYEYLNAEWHSNFEYECNLLLPKISLIRTLYSDTQAKVRLFKVKSEFF